MQLDFFHFTLSGETIFKTFIPRYRFCRFHAFHRTFFSFFPTLFFQERSSRWMDSSSVGIRYVDEDPTYRRGIWFIIGGLDFYTKAYETFPSINSFFYCCCCYLSYILYLMYYIENNIELLKYALSICISLTRNKKYKFVQLTNTFQFIYLRRSMI